MFSSPKMTPLLMAILCLATAGCANLADQETSETQHETQVAILKQIRKLNEDGSYTYGYEAGDGSFKVESRDVLGNIKGTFGFVDASGEIKRVSYSSSNGTGFTSTTVSPSQEQIAAVQALPKPGNRTTTPKRPSPTYATSTESATKSSVVQPIPRSRKTSTTPSPVSSSSSASTDEPVFVRPKNRPRFVVNGQQRPLALEDVAEDPEGDGGPDDDSRISGLRRLGLAKRPFEARLRPITELFEARDERESAKVASGNALRRQLPEATTKAAPVVELEADHSDVFGGALSTSRPLFMTTSSPRPSPPLRSADLRLERPTKAAPSNHRAADEERNPAQQVLVRTTARAPVDAHREYLVPVQHQGPDEHDDPAFRQIPLSRLLLRQEYGRLLQNQQPQQQPLYSGATDANVQRYLADGPPGTHEAEEVGPRAQPPPHPSYLVRQRAAYQTRPGPPPPPPQLPLADDRDYPYRASLALPPPPEAPNPIAPPLSRRDFQLLLRRLLVSQYGLQALNHPRGYLEDALYDQQPYAAYQPAYQAPLGPLADPPAYADRLGLRRPPGYSRALNPLYQQSPYAADEYPDARYARRAYGPKFYAGPEMTDDGQEILPPHIREALLLRMLQLVIGPERPQTAPNSLVMSTAIPPPTATRYRNGPVRSVQIIGEDPDDDKDARKKM